MTDTRPDDPKAAVGWRIRSTHDYGYRSNREGADAWATVLAVVTTESKREAYVVRFDDGATDLWVVDDPSDPYLWAPATRSGTSSVFIIFEGPTATDKVGSLIHMARDDAEASFVMGGPGTPDWDCGAMQPGWEKHEYDLRRPS